METAVLLALRPLATFLTREKNRVARAVEFRTKKKLEKRLDQPSNHTLQTSTSFLIRQPPPVYIINLETITLKKLMVRTVFSEPDNDSSKNSKLESPSPLPSQQVTPASKGAMDTPHQWIGPLISEKIDQSPYRPIEEKSEKPTIPTSKISAPPETPKTHTWIHNSNSSPVRCGYCADYYNNIVLCNSCSIRVCEDCLQVPRNPKETYCKNFQNPYTKEKTPEPLKPDSISPISQVTSAAHIDEGAWEISGPIWDHDSSPPPMFQQFNLTNHPPSFIDDPYFGRMDLDPDPWPEDPYGYDGCSNDDFDEDPNYW